MSNYTKLLTLNSLGVLAFIIIVYVVFIQHELHHANIYFLQDALVSSLVGGMVGYLLAEEEKFKKISLLVSSSFIFLVILIINFFHFFYSRFDFLVVLLELIFSLFCLFLYILEQK